MTANREDELERFKIEINLVEYAEAQGYEIDRRESSRASTVMRQGGDKIVVATDQDGHGIYFSVRDDADHGSVIDFAQRRHGLNLGKVRQELRPWISAPSAPSPSYRPTVQRKPEADRPQRPEPSTADRRQVLAVWSRMKPAQGRHAYLQGKRKLSGATLSDPRFAGMVREDAKGNAVFPHYDRAGLTGYELKNEGFTGFAKGGAKSIWHSANLEHAPRVVVVESAIDALSHAQMSKHRDSAYVSVGGSMSESQRALVRSVLADAEKRGAQIIVATDADEPGRALAAELKTMVSAAVRLEPPSGKDWNDHLRQVEQAREIEQQQTKAQRGHGMSGPG